ncbi:Thiol-disulfide oxidoreductase ResA [bacterium HR23]|nr:Thiol-disulfide oxidoreductase ResA [bacterium HR23]
MREPAPDFTLSLFGGGQFRLAEKRGTAVVVNFWGSWCPPCRAEMPALQKVWEAYQGQGLVLIGVNVQDTEADALAFLKEVGVTFPTGPDRDGSIAVAYRVIGFPTTIFINREGQVVRRWTGAISQERLTVLVEDLLR